MKETQGISVQKATALTITVQTLWGNRTHHRASSIQFTYILNIILLSGRSPKTLHVFLASSSRYGLLQIY